MNSHNSITVLLSGISLLAFSFIVELVVWRVRLPARQTPALLIVFALTPLCVIIAVWAMRTPFALFPADTVRLAMFYIAVSVAYIVLYSAIENPSPTLAMVSYLNKAGSRGAEEAELFATFGRDVALNSRIAVMRNGGWVSVDGDMINLTKQGFFVARLFQRASRIFGIPMGG